MDVNRRRAVETRNADRSAPWGCVFKVDCVSETASGADRIGPSGEYGVPREGLSENQGVDVVRPLVRVDRLDVAQVPARLVLVRDSDGAENLSCQAGALAGDPDVVPLSEGDLRRCRPAVVLQSA